MSITGDSPTDHRGLRAVADAPTDQEPPDLAERRFELDADIRRREMAIKEKEARRGWLTAQQATIAGAVLALVSGVAGALVTAYSSQRIEAGKSLSLLQIEELKSKASIELEKSKQSASEALEAKRFETTLILDAIKTPSRVDAIRNLKFFVAAGFIVDPQGKIAKLSDADLPSISVPTKENADRAIQSTGRITNTARSGTFLCTGVAISPHEVATASFCVHPNPQEPAGALSFEIRGRSYPLSVGPMLGKLAVLNTLEDLSPFLDRSKVRNPQIGEKLYVASMGVNQQISTLQNCSVSSIEPQSEDFYYDCDIGPGSAGAIIIATIDNAILGIHHSGGDGKGIGARLSAVWATLRVDRAVPR